MSASPWDAARADAALRTALPVAVSELVARGLPGTDLRERDLEWAMVAAFEREYPGRVRKNRKLPISGFQPNVGNVDLLIDRVPERVPCWLAELKWSYGTPDKIFEGAWDAVKLALALGEYDGSVTRCWLVTGAPAESWEATNCADLFEAGEIDVTQLWHRPLVPRRAPNMGNTVGEDLEIGGGANMFVRAPRLVIEPVATLAFDCGCEAWEIRAAAIQPQPPWTDPFPRTVAQGSA